MRIVKAHNPYGAAHQEPKRLVIHCMAEFVEQDGDAPLHAVDFLLEQSLSAHTLVAPDGTIYRCREDNEGAYHAKNFNTDSLGIEILVEGHHDYTSFRRTIGHPYVTKLQYSALLDQCREWVSKYRITQIDRHSDLSPGRKIDPGEGFVWGKFIRDLADNAASAG